MYGPERPDDIWALAGVRERRIVAKCSSTKQTSTVTSGSLPQKKFSSVLRFVPRQVSTKSRIVFHDKAGDGDGKHKTQSLKRSSKHVESSDVSWEVHKKIRVESIPNVQIVNREDTVTVK